MTLPLAIDILKEFVGPTPKKERGSWAEAVPKWEKHKARGACCFCGGAGEAYDVAADLPLFGLGNFTSFHLRRLPGTLVCLDCLRVLKESGLQNSAALYMIEAGSRGSRGAEGELVRDNVRLFEADAAGRRAFLARLLDGLPEKPFICGWKKPKTHAAPFSPVNPPGCRVVQILYQPADSAAPAVVFFDRERHRGLAAEAERWWREKKAGGLMEAHQGTLLLNFMLRITNPGKRPERKKAAED